MAKYRSSSSRTGWSVLFIILIWIMGIIGYIRCWYQFCTSDFSSSYKREIVYGIGIATGAGAIIGWLDIPDNKTIN